MVTLSLQTIQELQEIIRNDYGEELSAEKTTELGKVLISYFDLLASIHHRSTTLARADESESSSVARDEDSLGAKTSV